MEERNITLNFGGFAPLLAIAFIVLKLCNIINWSWLWVLAPIWIPVAIVVVAWVIAFVVCLIVHLVDMFS